MLHVVLFPLYWIVITPAGWVMRLVHDPLRRRWDPNAETYLTVPGTARPYKGASRAE